MSMKRHVVSEAAIQDKQTFDRCSMIFALAGCCCFVVEMRMFRSSSLDDETRLGKDV